MHRPLRSFVLATDNYPPRRNASQWLLGTFCQQKVQRVENWQMRVSEGKVNQSAKFFVPLPLETSHHCDTTQNHTHGSRNTATMLHSLPRSGQRAPRCGVPRRLTTRSTAQSVGGVPTRLQPHIARLSGRTQSRGPNNRQVWLTTLALLL